MSKNRRSNQNQPIHEGDFTPIEEDAEEFKKPVPEAAPETPTAEPVKHSWLYNRAAAFMKNEDERKQLKAAAKSSKDSDPKPKKRFGVGKILAIGGGAAAAAWIALNAVARNGQGADTLQLESGEDSDSYSSDSVDDGIELVTDDTQE